MVSVKQFVFVAEYSYYVNSDHVLSNVGVLYHMIYHHISDNRVICRGATESRSSKHMKRKGLMIPHVSELHLKCQFFTQSSV